MFRSTRTPLRLRFALFLPFLLLCAAASWAQPRIVAPNGGERFRVGSTTTIRWAGILPTDTVTLEYSIDNGANWRTITNRGLGLQHVWGPIPNTPSEFCLMRITTGAKIGDSVLYLESRREGSFIGDAIHWAEFSPDGTRVIGGSATGYVFIWDSFTGDTIRTIQVEPGTGDYNPPGITLISQARYDPSGRLFATLSPIPKAIGSIVRIYDATTGAKLREWQRHEGFVGRDSTSTSSRCVFSPDGTRLLVMGLKGGTIYNVADGSVAAEVTGYEGVIATTTFVGSMVDGDWSRDGATIIGASNIGSASLPDFVRSDPATGNPTSSYPGTPPEMSTVRFNPAATRFISTSTDGSVRVHDVTDASVIYDIRDYERYPNEADFSNDGQTFATAGQDVQMPNWKLHLYDANTGAFIRTVGAIINGMRNLDFSPDDARILVSCIDGARIFRARDTTAGGSDVSDSLWAIFVTPGAAVTISAGTVTARQGETVEVPIVIDNPGDALAAGASRVDMTLRYNVTLLDPLDPTPRGTIDPAERTIPLSFPIVSATDTILGVLRFRAALGNDSTTTLDLNGVVTDMPTVTVLERDGLFRLADLCYEGGPRLLNPNGVVSLKITASDSKAATYEAEITTLEGGRTSLTLVDLMGRTVRTLLDGEAPPGHWRAPLELTDVAMGRYFVVLRTRTIVKTATLEVTQ